MNNLKLNWSIYTLRNRTGMKSSGFNIQGTTMAEGQGQLLMGDISG